MFVKRRHLMSFTHTLHPSRKNIRLSPMVYQLSGLTFLTVCTLDREPLFGCIEQGSSASYGNWESGGGSSGLVCQPVYGDGNPAMGGDAQPYPFIGTPKSG